MRLKSISILLYRNPAKKSRGKMVEISNNAMLYLCNLT